MKKLISILFSAVLVALLSVTAFAAEFNPSLTVDRSTDGIILVTVANDAQTNEVLAEKKPRLTIACDWNNAVLLSDGGHTELQNPDSKVTFSISHGGTYILTNQEYSIATVEASCTRAGKYIYTVGNSTFEETIPAAGHDFSNIHCPTCANCSERNPYYVPSYYPSEKPVTEKPEPTQPENPFEDVSKNDFYYDAVIWAAQNGITSGISKTMFDPNGTCTRAQMVTFLWRAAGEPEPASAVNPFTDVDAGNYCYKAVLWAVERGITKGTSVTTFSPDDTCTRAQAMTFLYRLAGLPAAGESTPFTDVNTTEYYYNAVIWGVAEEITAGTSATTFSPDDFCTRGQIVTFLYRYLVG